MSKANMLKKNFYTPGDLWQTAMELAAERDETLSDVLRQALATYTETQTPCSECGECAVCGGEVLELETHATLDEGQATIVGYGRFDETSHPEVKALIERAKELLAVGAVGVSVATDLDPADLPNDPDAVTEEDIRAAKQRNRHVAIVDTPAFSGAYLDLAADGMSVSGPLVFEGQITGDIRSIGDVGSFNLDDPTILPMPIIFDLYDGDHTGVVVGHIDRLERVNGIVGAETAPVAASLTGEAYPSYLFSEPEPTAMTVSAPDANGYRRYSGIIAPAGVCHKGMRGCYTYKGASLDYFHSGARIPLDDGTYTRVGPLMFGDLHADGSKMDYAEALTRTNEDARTVAAMGRVFAHPKGALFSGVLMPDADVMRVQACAPSVELWPDHRGKLELKTALLVPRPALPVAASLGGGGVQLAEADEPVVNEPQGDHFTRLEELSDRLDALEETTGELLAAHLAATL
jgi:hypothetical protein